MPETAETFAAGLEAVLAPNPKPAHKYGVVERAYSRERVVFESDSLEDAKRVAGQHAARRVVING